MFGDRRVAGWFTDHGSRPARFARYTSRTLYPGVRTREKDQIRLRPIQQFYVDLLERAATDTPEGARAAALTANLRSRGKWPAKPDLLAWYGAKGTRWTNDAAEFVRAVTLPDDPELFTRHEVLVSPPDLLVTNYSMLEYMLMRPLERPIFDATRDWLAENDSERLTLVVDEAHLYRGAAGAEVGLLLRRLRARLGIPPDRLQVIATSASFHNPEHARTFAAQLAGKDPSDFDVVLGELALRPSQGRGAEADAAALSAVDLDAFYAAESDEARLAALRPFLDFRGVEARDSVGVALFDALKSFPPMSLLVNLTMREAQPLGELGKQVFELDDLERADRALTSLVALGSVARKTEGQPGLLPCRVHTFFRGLPGLWACSDPDCPTVVDDADRGPVGKLFAQPQDVCDCGARVFEFYTCRHCGAAYLRAYTDEIETPDYLWAEPGGEFVAVGGVTRELQPVDLCLEEPIPEGIEPADLEPCHRPCEPAGARRENATGFSSASRSRGQRRGGERSAARPRVPAVWNLRPIRSVWAFFGSGPPDQRRPAVPGPRNSPTPGPAPKSPAAVRVRTPSGAQGAGIFGLKANGSSARTEPTDLLDARRASPPDPRWGARTSARRGAQSVHEP
jgi:hypothetical protein